MDSTGALRAQLNGLKLSNGMRAGDIATPPSNTSINVTSTLKILMSEECRRTAPQEEFAFAGGKGTAAQHASPVHSPSSVVQKLQLRPQFSSRSQLQANKATGVGASAATAVERGANISSKLSASENANAASGSNSKGKSVTSKPTRIMRAAPRSQQTADNASPSSALEQLLKTLPSTTNVSTLREPASPPGPPPYPLVVLKPNVDENAIRMVTVVTGDAKNPILVESIDNTGAQKPIVRTAPPCEHRYIIVGDVHGCPEQLEELMLKVDYKKGKDCLILAGDFVNKGPDSIGAVRAAQRLGAIGVLGNHDYTLLNCITQCIDKRKLSPKEDADPVMQLASKFPTECEEYLRSLPHILCIPRYNVTVVHAGLNVDTPLENQNVYEIMHLRRLERLDDKYHQDQKWRAVVKSNRGKAWGSLWKGPETVIFGHDARAGFQEHPFAYGIDTGCVYGQQLTCVVYDRENPKGTFVSVPGLPKLTNEKYGLPPPAAPVYDQYAEELERLIMRPTTRATPPVISNGCKPTFLAVPPVLTSSSDVAMPDRWAAAPSTGRDSAVEQSTLLALSRAQELRAISILIGLPMYEAAWLALLEGNTEETTRSFWVPFVTGVLDGLSNVSSSESADDYVDEVLRLALEACDEIEEVRVAAAAQLQVLAAREEAGAMQLSKATAKFLRLLSSA